MQTLLTSLLCAFLALGATAAEKPPRDFSAGFEKLCELAQIPDLTGATPGEVEEVKWECLSRNIREMSRAEYTDAPTSWRLGENADGSQRILLGELCLVSLYPLSDPDESRLRGTWVPQPLDTLASQLERLSKGIRTETQDPHSRRTVDREAGELLLRAAFLFAAGQREAASRCATLLLPEDRAEPVLATACRFSAEYRYSVAFEELVRTGDRAAFVEALGHIGERFPQGWPRLAGMEQVRRTMQAPMTAAATEAAASLSQEDRDLLAELMAERTRRELPGRDRFLFLAPANLSRTDANCPLARVLRKGVGAFPILFALAEDQRASPFPIAATRPNRYYTEQVFSNDDEAAPGGMESQDYMGLPRLLTGEELARELLWRMWDTVWESDLTDREDALDNAKAWYASHRGLSHVELAERLLGEPVGRGIAIRYLLSLPQTEENYATIEEAIPKLGFLPRLYALIRLVDRRGEAARPALNRAIAQTRAEEDGRWHAKEMEKLLPMAPASKEAVAAFRRSLDEAVLERREHDLEELVNMESHRFIGNKDLAGEILERAARCGDAGCRSMLLCFVRVLLGEVRSHVPYFAPTQVTWEEFDHPPVPEQDEEERPMLKLDLVRYGPAWRKLLFAFPPDSVFFPEDTALWLFQRMYGGGIVPPPGTTYMQYSGLFDALPGGMRRRSIQRARSLLENPEAPLAPWPDPGTVEPKRVAELAAALTKLPSAAARKHVLALPDNEHLALMQALRKHQALATHLLAGHRTTLPACRFLGDAPPPLRDAFSRFSGETLSSELAEAILAKGGDLLAEGQSFAALFEAGPGLNTHFEVMPLDSSPEPNIETSMVLGRVSHKLRKERRSGICLQLAAGEEWQAFWPVQTRSRPANAANTGLDKPLVKSDEETENEQDRVALLKALEEIPKGVQHKPMGKISFLIIGINRRMWSSFYDKGRN